jgi:tetratricopeptide (TPR) repeat protein
MSPLSVSFDFTRFVQAFTSSGERGLLDMAMHCYETTLISHPGFATVSVDMFLQNLGATAWKTYASSKDVAMLEMTIIVCNEILKLRPEGHKCHVASLINLAVSLECSYDNQHYNVGRLDEAITMLRRAVELSSLGGSCTARFMAMGQLGSALDVCYKHQRDVNSLAEAVVWHRGALQLCPLEYPQRCRFINSLAAALMTQFEQLGNMDSFVETIVLHRQALELRPVGHPHRPCSLNNLAAMLGERFKQLGELDLLTETIDLRRQVLDLRPLGHPSHLSSLNNLAVALMTRFEKVDDMDSFAEALALHRQALDLHPVGHSDRSTSLNNLANALARRYEHLGEVDSLAETLDLHRQALDLRPPGHPNRSISLYSLASALVIRFRQFGELDSLQEAVDLHRQALDLRPLGHCQRSASLHNLATTLTTRFRRLGDIDSLEEALILLRQALDLRPVGHPHRPCSLTSLANVLVTRFEQLGGLCSLAEAIDMRRQVLDIRPQGHPGRSSSLNNLAMSLVTRFEQLGDLCSLGEAIDLHRQAVNLCPLRSPDRARSLHNLAIALICQFEQSGGLNLLTEAIDLHRQDLDLLPLGHCERPDSLCGLTYALSKRYEQLGDLNSLSEAFLLHRQALHLCRPGHPNRFHFLSGIAGCMLQKVPHTFDFIGGIRHIREALQENVTPVRIRLRNMTSLLRTVETAYQSMTGGTGSDYDDMVLQMYMLTIRLLPRAASFGHDHITRLQELSLDESLSRNAAARAIIMKREEEAVEMLEEGRGVFWAQAVRLRGIQLDLLPPEDAQELKGLLQNLEAGSVRDDTLTLVQQDRQAGKRRLQSEAADAIIADIRSRPGMERFLMPPAFNSLAQSLPVGFVILLNISELGQHALIMDGSTKSVSSVSLKLPVRMSGSKLRAVQQKSSRDAASTEVDVSNAEFPVTVKQGEEPRASGVRERVIRTFEDSLADLWSFIVKPIIDVLQLKVL